MSTPTILKSREIIISILCIAIGIIIGFILFHGYTFDEEVSVDRVIYLLDNLDDLPMVTEMVNTNSSISDIMWLYHLKENRAKFIMSVMLRGICVE